MASVGTFSHEEITIENKAFSSFKTIVESAFYGNNVEVISDLASAYDLARKAPGAVVTDMPVSHATNLGLPEDAKVIVFNDGNVTGRTASARRVIGQPGIDKTLYEGVLRDALAQGTHKKFYAGEVVVGLDKDFMVKAHLILPENYETNFYSYLLNFQIMNHEWRALYQDSKNYPETDIYLYADPDWTHPAFPHGLALFDSEHNVAAILGLKYFGELKKATLTLAWSIAHRNGYVACHGGMKEYQFSDKKFTMAAFGLSGSGKSTITLAEHNDKYQIKVLHDDAFVINQLDGSTTALEPSYFDKTQDYSLTDPAINFFMTCQNVGVTLDNDGKKVIVTQDIRNGNGRTVKSRYVTQNRVDHLCSSLDAIFWIMKDDTLPPVVKIDDSVLAAVFGLTLATKRSTAENIVDNKDRDNLVIEPFANPFRVYPLGEDFEDFKTLFNKNQTACYILNTGFYQGKKVTPQDTLSSIEKIVEKQAKFVSFGPISGMNYLPLEGFEVNFDDAKYMKALRERMESRLTFILNQNSERKGYNALPEEAITTMRRVITELS
ncbi:phosphoenolpyruvate carboxykinase (ATP) [Enterococcus dispar]|uniref:phosphoenolpyruvate carboxykinase (ATP) n=1 Tax=Enterococcus dispar TaxID=44009 RepID=UPI00249058BD|nr:phosphoenolpyruvate carboxykinase (ATP) [Enterococcus dispar]